MAEQQRDRYLKALTEESKCRAAAESALGEQIDNMQRSVWRKLGR